MTPCEKLGYKVGDNFVTKCADQGFKKGQIITLFRDDGSQSPCFKGDNTMYTNAGGEQGAHFLLGDVKPVSQRATKPISKSKRQLAQLLIEAGVTQFPEGVNWAAQDSDKDVDFFTDKPYKELSWWQGDYDAENRVSLSVKIPNWHQTVLSRDEFDRIVAETEPQYCESVMRSIPEPTAAPTLDQLLQDWRNADGYAQRKQTEADEAAAMRDERWQAVQARAGEMGVTVGRCEGAVAVAGDDGWTEWCGDERPVERSVLVDVKLKGGRHVYGVPAESLPWFHINDDLDVSAYRLARP